MKRLNDSGVIGILDRILTPENTPAPSNAPIPGVASGSETAPVVDTGATASRPNTGIPVWRGRPPSKPGAAAAVKQKLTVRVDSELADSYRDWSWECRLQLSPLIERALKEYLRVRKDCRNGPR
jgi:hypothetical protein